MYHSRLSQEKSGEAELEIGGNELVSRRGGESGVRSFGHHNMILLSIFTLAIDVCLIMVIENLVLFPTSLTPLK